MNFSARISKRILNFFNQEADLHDSENGWKCQGFLGAAETGQAIFVLLNVPGFVSLPKQNVDLQHQ